MSTITELPDRELAVAIHAKLVRSSPKQLVTLASAAALAAEIAANPAQLQAAWGLLGAWALRELDRMMLTEGRPREKHRRHPLRPPSAPTAGQTIDPKAQAMSWYQKLPLWKRPVPIGNTGARKQLGELTHGDCRTIAQFYGQSATTLREKADRWSAIGNCLKGPETLGSAHKKLAASTLAWLLDETGGEGAND